MQTFKSKFSANKQPEYSFAGFDFPRHVPIDDSHLSMPLSKRMERYKSMVTSGYYINPGLEGVQGTSFYLESDFMPALRYEWCDEVDGASINHTGWYTTEYGDGDTIRGIVMRLPKGRGFLAGWSMGEGMASWVEYDIYDDEESAAYAADSMAENVADRDRQIQLENDAA